MKNIRTIKRLCKELNCEFEKCGKDFFGYERIEIDAPNGSIFIANDGAFLTYIFDNDTPKKDIYECIIEDLNEGLR